LNTAPDLPLPSAAPKQHRKGVDTKASKGRKVRYTVHEKLQNFVAEEERGTWTESARREFFASLFGGQGMLNEDQDVDMDGDERVGEEGALRLFRN
jgi:protein AATF/BFR2